MDMPAWMDLKTFALEILGALFGGFLSEQVVKHPEIFGILGKYGTPVAGAVVGLLGQYLEAQRTVPVEIAKILQFGGAVTVGNWVWEILKGSLGGTSVRVKPTGTRAEIVYLPPTIERKPRAIIL